MKQKLYLAMLLALTLTACSQKEDHTDVKPNVRGEWISDNHYTNDFFELSVKIPQEWQLEKGTNEFMNESTKDLFAGDDQKLKAHFDSAIEKTYTVFWAHRYPIGTKEKTNPNVSIMIENVNDAENIQSAADYLKFPENTVSVGQNNFSYVDKPTLVNLGGLEFWKRSLKISNSAIEAHQEHYGILKENYILILCVTTVSDEDKQIAAELTDTVARLRK